MIRKIHIETIVIYILLFFGELSSSFIRPAIIPKRDITTKPLPNFVNITIIKDIENDIDTYRRINSSSILRRRSVLDEFEEFSKRGHNSLTFII
jgi:hypothetical protein